MTYVFFAYDTVLINETWRDKVNARLEVSKANFIIKILDYPGQWKKIHEVQVEWYITWLDVKVRHASLLDVWNASCVLFHSSLDFEKRLYEFAC